MKITKSTLAGILVASFALSAQAQDKAKVAEKAEPKAEEKVRIDGAKVGHWTMDYAAAVKLAAEKKLPLMLDFTGSDWCGWCTKMQKSVFSQEAWKKFAAENVVLVTIDFPRDKSVVPEKYVEQNKKLKEQFGVRGFPTYIILDSDGQTKIGQLGAGRNVTPEDFIIDFKGAVRLSESNIAAFIKEHPDKADAFKAAIQEIKDWEKALSDWVATKPKPNEENTKKFKELQARIKAAKEKVNSF